MLDSVIVVGGNNNSQYAYHLVPGRFCAALIDVVTHPAEDSRRDSYLGFENEFEHK